MIWSKKHRLFKEHLAPSLVNRLALHTAGYHKAYEGRGRTWLEFDGEEVLSFCEFTHENEWRKTQDLNAVYAAGVFSKSEFGFALGRFLAMSIEAALESDDPLILALAMLDRRTGKRRLMKIRGTILIEPARTILNLRLAAEGIHPTEPSDFQ